MKQSSRGNWKLALGLVVGVLAGGAVVYADGGDAGQVHACLIDGAGADGRPNTIILGANDACPAGTTPAHWAVAGPPGPQGQDAAPNAVLSPGFVHVKKSKGPNTQLIKKVSAQCPLSHPKAVSGDVEWSPNQTPQKKKPIHMDIYESGPNTTGLFVGLAWKARVGKPWVFTPIPGPFGGLNATYLETLSWKLTVTATCAKSG